MLSILFMTVFCEPDPMVFASGKGDTTLFGRVLTGPQINREGTLITPTQVDAVASLKNGTDDKAQTYFDALKEARNADALTEKVSVRANDKQFIISNFKTQGTNALLKFCKIGKDLARKVLTCVIDLASVVKDPASVNSADKVKAEWLDYFWKLWNEKDTIFQKADFTDSTTQQIENFAKETTKKKAQDEESAAYPNTKGLLPRQFTQEEENSESEAGKTARTREKNQHVPTLLRIKNMGINIDKIMLSFKIKTGELLENIENTKAGIEEQFDADVNPPETDQQSEGHKLNQAWWSVIWNSLVKIASTQPSEEEAETLHQETLLKLEEVEKKYR